MTPSIAIVIPTRNRADLAIEAVRSLRTVADPRLGHIVVSDNSSEPEHVRALADQCGPATDRRLLHLRPPGPLPMAEHWDWAIGETLARSGATHLGIHYDRRISKPELPLLFDIAAQWPDVPVTYLVDQLYPHRSRFHMHQMPWSGGVYELLTERALCLAARGLLTDRWQAFPVLANSLTPRPVLERVRARFGSFCASLTPDSCFGFRFAALEERYLHFDRPLGIYYGYERSNGIGYLRGETGGAFGDFARLYGDRPWLDAAPLPGLSLGQNIFYHEYCRVQREAGDERFPPIDMEGYLSDLARGLSWIADEGRRAELRALLVAHGWRGDGPEPKAALPERPTMRVRLDRFRVDYLYVKPADLSLSSFKSEARALRYARKFPRPPSANHFLAPLEPVRLR